MEFKETLLTEDELGIIYRCISREVIKYSKELTTEPFDDFTSEEMWQIRTHLGTPVQLKIFADYFKKYIREEIGILERMNKHADIESKESLARFINYVSDNYAERMVNSQLSGVTNPEI